ncbi:MAG: hypothetical protein COV09_00120 [Candidatus Vogelbacteria bacterium CG10_big_fil_rev_8_21_14_0_10_50_13]|uniref:Uncharacterized protein n=1 Tax=Candidatus Vogelbacteria bacterium CG10_big_fil_rev_8_21_14_0_10_50_13 TaxID=1975044 RepID=A0A2H0RGU0_9BACT|nr:MAG: hypothetical protein COV09_00120 [Candidatus Vogelbacteria bacterium CG10_big_fil_rev_8_21_14_0_10_50_13]
MTKTSRLIDQLPAFLLYAIIFLIPIAFWPSPYILAGADKKFLFLILAAALAVVWWLSRVKAPTISLPGRWWLLALWSLPAVALVSSLFSGAPHHSLISLGIENATAWAFGWWALFATLAVMVWFNRRAAGLYGLVAILSVGVLVALFQWSKLLFGNFTQLAIFANPAANLIGKWNEFGLFMGLTVVLAIAFLEFLPWRRMPLPAGLAWFGLGLGLISLVVVNYWYSWLLVGSAAIIILATKLIRDRRLVELEAARPAGWRYLWSRPVLVLILAVVLILIGNQVVWPAAAERVGLAEQITAAGDWLGVQVLEVSPSWRGTAQVTAGAVKELFGVGPNKFASAWFKYRPSDVNASPFWTMSFDYGIGFWPSLAVTMGILGVVAGALFFLISINFLLKGLFAAKFQTDANWPLLSVAAMGTLYLLAASTIYPTGTTLLVYLFVFLSLFIALSTTIGLTPPWKIKWASADGDLPVWHLAGGIIIGLTLLLFLVQSLLASFYFSRALAAVNRDDNQVKGEILLTKAISVSRHDLFYRSLVDLEQLFLSDLVQNQELKPEEAQVRFQNILAALVDNSRRAVDYNETNYLNWEYQGRAFESVVPLEIGGAYEAALAAYGRARVESGDLPSILLDLARLEAIAGHPAQAKDYLTVALAKKPNYTGAIFVLAQIEAEAGNLAAAINLADQAMAAEPNHPPTFFAAGLLKYQAAEYFSAATALERAVELNANYANARYFLGLAYSRLGRQAEALEQFKIILTSNDLPEIRQIIANLEAGQPALAEIPPPAPEDREELPVEEVEE